MARDLKTRVQTHANTTATQRSGGDVDVPIEGRIRQMQEQFALAMPRGAEATQLVRDAITALRTTKNLAACDQASILGGLMTCAQLGLRPGVLGHAWLLPFWDRHAGPEGRGGHRAQLVIGYQGLVELAHRSGKISSLIARTVHEHDVFDIDYGLADTLIHKPKIFGDRGPAVAYYAIAKYTTGGHSFFVMSQSDVEAYRDRFATAKTREGKVVGPWKDNFESMAHKTCVRQLAKWMPKSTDLATGIQADGSIRVDLAPDRLDTVAPVQVEQRALAAREQPVEHVDGHVLPDDDAGQGDPSQDASAGGATGRDDQLPAGIDPATGEVIDVEDPPDVDWGEVTQPGSGKTTATKAAQ